LNLVAPDTNSHGRPIHGEVRPSSTMMCDEVWSKFCVQADDDFAHDCDDGDHFWFPGFGQSVEEVAHVGIVGSGAEGGGEEGAFDGTSSAEDGSVFAGDAAVSCVGSATRETGSGTAGEASEFGQKGLQDAGGPLANPRFARS
jgi:hypothetical protein